MGSLMDIAQCYQYFEFVEDHSVLISVKNDALGIWSQCIVYPTVQRLMSVHASQDPFREFIFYRICTWVKQESRWKCLYSGYIFSLTFIQWNS